MHDILSFDSNPLDFNTKNHIMAGWVAWREEWVFGGQNIFETWETCVLACLSLAHVDHASWNAHS